MAPTLGKHAEKQQFAMKTFLARSSSKWQAFITKPVGNFFCTWYSSNNCWHKTILILKDKISNIREISLLLNKCKWSKDDIDNCLKQYIIDKSIKFKDIGPALRLALTGKTNSPDLVTVIYELGCTITLNRLNYIY